MWSNASCETVSQADGFLYCWRRCWISEELVEGTSEELAGETDPEVFRRRLKRGMRVRGVCFEGRWEEGDFGGC